MLSIAVYTRDRVNPYLFNYCFSVALLHRPDTQDITIPSFIHSFPDKYVDGKVFAKAREQATVIPEGSRVNKIYKNNIKQNLHSLIKEFATTIFSIFTIF